MFIYFLGSYINPYMKEIYHTELIQEWKLNLYTAAYLKKLDKKKEFRQRKNNLIGMIAKKFWPKLLLETWNGFLFRVLCCLQQIIFSFQKSELLYFWNIETCVEISNICFHKNNIFSGVKFCRCHSSCILKTQTIHFLFI